METEPTRIEGNGDANDAGAQNPLATTVAWPVEIELDLIAPIDVPVVAGVEALGSGKRARLRGQIFGRSGVGVRANLLLRSGLNAGTRIETASDGTFGPVDLYPGLAEIEVSAPGVPGSVRELRLATGQATDFNVSYGLPGVALGRVTDNGQKGIEGVEVELDGQKTLTDAEGNFRFADMTGGDNLLIVLKKQGYAARMRRVGIAAGRTTESDNLRFQLDPGCSLDVSVLDKAGVGDKAQVVILPANPDIERTFPWHRLAPLEVVAGSTLRLDDLPAARVTVRVYHHGAVAEPESDSITLRPGIRAVHQVHMRPVSSSAGSKPTASAPQRDSVKRVYGQITDRTGTGISNARVVLEVPDRAAVANTYLGDPSGAGAIHREMIPALAQVAQTARTDSTGRYAFTVWTFYATSAHYLSAESPDGTLRGARLVRLPEEEANLVLEPVAKSSATLRLVFNGRTQALPVVASIDGQSLGQRVIPVDEDFVLEGLRQGTWNLTASWNATPVGGGGEFTLKGERAVELTLPAGAILGQDPDTLMRARGY